MSHACFNVSGPAQKVICKSFSSQLHRPSSALEQRLPDALQHAETSQHSDVQWTQLANQLSNKWLVLQVFVCRSGSAADTQNLSAYVQHFLHQHSMELDSFVSVKTAARLATQLTYQNKVSIHPIGSTALPLSCRLLDQAGCVCTPTRVCSGCGSRISGAIVESSQLRASSDLHPFL